jgi:hypothetical protein
LVLVLAADSRFCFASQKCFLQRSRKGVLQKKRQGLILILPPSAGKLFGRTGSQNICRRFTVLFERNETKSKKKKLFIIKLLYNLRNQNLFNLQPSTFNLQPSTLNLKPSTFNLQPSTFNFQPSTFNFKPSTFNLQPLSQQRNIPLFC